MRATPSHPTLYATGLVDLDEHILIDMVEGNSADDLRRWCEHQDPEWLADIRVVTTDLAESYRAGLDPHLAHATRVADPFHVVRVGNRCVDTVRRRVQNETLGHRGPHMSARSGTPGAGQSAPRAVGLAGGRVEVVHRRPYDSSIAKLVDTHHG